ncbi:hypothetical protein B0T14DRAFT_561798 [Immersiella caudata]|uniref:Uncharacterized protein n=1 Tax=Immersiella caudata TaxID=314043 RepID=A0AA40C5I3_9PEZI|nr:hypothetical protein B0T14DRAFT_561798 [Immersiella caudata]
MDTVLKAPTQGEIRNGFGWASPLESNDNPEFYRAGDAVLNHAIPTAREAGIQIIWITTGYSDDDLAKLDPGVFRTFNFGPVSVSPDVSWQKLPPGEAWSKKGMYRNQKGGGDDIGEVTDKNGKVIDAGRILVKGSWNSWLHDPLSDAHEEGKKSATPPDVHIYKIRNSGMTLPFTSINIDQCVMGTLQDAYPKGFDTILLKDGERFSRRHGRQRALDARHTEYSKFRNYEDLIEHVNEIRDEPLPDAVSLELSMIRLRLAVFRDFGSIFAERLRLNLEFSPHRYVSQR